MQFTIYDGLKKLGAITIEKGSVTAADHELRYMKGWIKASVDEYVKTCGWKIKRATAAR